MTQTKTEDVEQMYVKIKTADTESIYESKRCEVKAWVNEPHKANVYIDGQIITVDWTRTKVIVLSKNGRKLATYKSSETKWLD